MIYNTYISIQRNTDHTSSTTHKSC